MLALMMAHLKEPPDLEGLPEAERKVLEKALAKVPAERYGSCKEFVRALEQAVAPPTTASSPSVPTLPETSWKPAPAAPAKAPRWLVPAAAGLFHRPSGRAGR